MSSLHGPRILDELLQITKMIILVETNYPNFDAPSTTRTESSPTENSDKSDDEPTFLLEFGSDFENSQK